MNPNSYYKTCGVNPRPLRSGSARGGGLALGLVLTALAGTPEIEAQTPDPPTAPAPAPTPVPAPAPATPPTPAVPDSARFQLDSLRVEFERIGRARAEEVLRALEAHRGEFETVRIQLRREADSLRATLDPSLAPRIYVDGVEVMREGMVEMIREDGDGRERVTVTTLPLLAGQRMVAGLELTELNPSLARYFDVESGVLVTNVTEPSPGADAGILPGDVLIEVGGEPVHTVGEVRARFSQIVLMTASGDRGGTIVLRGPGSPESGGAEAVPVRVIREGEPLELVVPR